MNDELTANDAARFRDRLLKRQAELKDALTGATQRSETVQLDQQSVGRVSRGDALQQQAMANANRQHYEQQLRLIAAALRRIEEGDYGLCMACDEPISSPRLDAQPEVRLCLACQSETERGA
jgi:DnaK suppressor protein